MFGAMELPPLTLFSGLANETRLRSVVLLLQNDELCVCELMHALTLSQPHVSRHLGLLRENGLVLDRREGQWVHYRIHPQLADWERRILNELFKGVATQAPFIDDARALLEMPDRPARSA